MTDSNQGTNPYLYALSCISGKWKMSILNHINYYGFIRFSKPRRHFRSAKRFSVSSLKELVADGLVERIQYNEIPLRVEYHLTETGKNIIPALDLIYVWSIHRMRELDIEIDPDAFVVHPEDKYEGSLKKSSSTTTTISAPSWNMPTTTISTEKKFSTSSKPMSPQIRGLFFEYHVFQQEGDSHAVNQPVGQNITCHLRQTAKGLLKEGT